MEADEILNVEGKSCPMPLFFTKKALNKLEAGQILQVVGDFLPAKENIVENAEKKGHKVLEIKEEANPYQFSIYLKKF